MGYSCEYMKKALEADAGSFQPPYPCVWVERFANGEALLPYPCAETKRFFELYRTLTNVGAAQKESYWGTLVSDMQSNIEASGKIVNGNFVGKITGTLKYLDEGQLVTDWGAGNFIALRFYTPVGMTSCKVGLVPSEGSGMQELDEDRDGVFKITDKNAQKLVIVTKRKDVTATIEYDLSELVCETE